MLSADPPSSAITSEPEQNLPPERPAAAAAPTIEPVVTTQAEAAALPPVETTAEQPRSAPAVAAPPAEEIAAHAPVVDEAPAAPARQHRFLLLAASLTLAAGLGAALGGAGVAGIVKFQAAPQAAAKAAGVSRAELNDELKGLRDSIGHVRTALRSLTETVGGLRAQVDAKATAAQFAKLNEALERIEKAQAEPAGRLTKAVEALERLDKRAAAPSPEVTGSVGAPQPRNLAVPHASEPATLRMPVLEGWNLRRVINGVAILEGRMGVIEAEVGDTVPGLGRIEDMKRQDGRWVVVTNRGVVQAR